MKWVKNIILGCIVFIIGCRKVPINPDPKQEQVVDIFSVKEINVANGQDLKFNLKAEGTYILTLFDSTSQQVIARERVVGKIGQNNINLYTKTLPVRYLYLSLEDENNALIGKTLVVIN